KWGLVAPGGTAQGTADDNVISTDLGGGYVAAAGTSMSAPHVAGAVAVLLGMGLSPTAAVQRVLATLSATPPCGAGCKGRLDMAAAVAGGGRAPVGPGGGAGPLTTAAGPPGTTANEPRVSTRASGQRHPTTPSGGDRSAVPIVVAAVLVVAVGAGCGALGR